MRELTSREIEEVSGGVGPLGAAVGGVVGFTSAVYAGASADRIVAATALGALSGLAGNFAGAAAAGGLVMRGAWAARAAGLGFASSAASADAGVDGNS